MVPKSAQTVFVGMSGGVDSSVSAYLLKQATPNNFQKLFGRPTPKGFRGYNVVGVFIKVWHPDFLPCHWERERLDAMRVAAHLEIPFLTCDAEEVYKKEVADYFIAEYRAGRTPNPDVMCNTQVKFGAFYKFAREKGADYIATGHYARTETPDGETHLLRGVDTEKDQSYFLWNIGRETLSRTFFPIGHMTKKEVRAIAQKAKLPTAQKDESQGICFLGHVDIPDFLRHYLTLEEGSVLNEKGEVVGTHTGAQVYTIGQRHGFYIHPEHSHTEAHFVIAKNTETNTITISPQKPEAKERDSKLTLHGSYLKVVVGTEVSVQTRYRQTPTRAFIDAYTEGALTLTLLEKSDLPVQGQSCVLYDGERVVGGGTIEGILGTK